MGEDGSVDDASKHVAADRDDLAPACDPDGEWRDVAETVGLADEPWWEVAAEAEEEGAPRRPDDELWHDDGEDARERPVEGLTDVDVPAERGWFASLDRTQRLAILGIFLLAGCFAVLTFGFGWLLVG